MPNYFNQAIDAIENASDRLAKECKDEKLSKDVRGLLDEAVECLGETAEVYGITTEEDEPPCADCARSYGNNSPCKCNKE
jgi:hypothetical protein